MKKICKGLSFAYPVLKINVCKKVRIPIAITFVLTNKCPNRCIYCQTHKLLQKDTFDTKKIKSILNEMKSMGTRRVHFSGGEPMMRSDIQDIIRYAKRLDFFITLATSGYGVLDSIDELKQIDALFISYDGPSEIHARLRGERSVQDSLSAISELKQKKKPLVFTTTVLTRLNYQYVTEIVSFAKANKLIANFNILEFIHDSLMNPHLLLSHVKDLVLNKAQRKECFGKLIEMKKLGMPVGNSYGYLKHAIKWPHDDKIVSTDASKDYACWAGKAYGIIDAEGMLYPCSLMVGGKGGQSVLTHSFQTAWNALDLQVQCKSCLPACGVENNLLFSLHLPTIINRIILS